MLLFNLKSYFFGIKVGMSQIFDEVGIIQTITIVKISSCQIIQIKKFKLENFSSVQLAFYLKKKTSSNTILEYLKKSCKGIINYFWEFYLKASFPYLLGQKINNNALFLGQSLKVSGACSGKGFSGSIKRYHFNKGPMSHGSKNHRLLGSIGAGTTPGRVFPGKKMAGQLGNKNCTKHSKIFFFDKKNNLATFKGSLPGKKNTILKFYPE